MNNFVINKIYEYIKPDKIWVVTVFHKRNNTYSPIKKTKIQDNIHVHSAMDNISINDMWLIDRTKSFQVHGVKLYKNKYDAAKYMLEFVRKFNKIRSVSLDIINLMKTSNTPKVTISLGDYDFYTIYMRQEKIYDYQKSLRY